MGGQPNPERLPEVLDPGSLEERGITIPAPTPKGISMLNPWGKPSAVDSEGAAEHEQDAAPSSSAEEDTAPADQ